MNVKQLKEKRRLVWAQMEAIRDAANADSRDYTPDELTRWDALETELNQWTDKIQRAEREEKLSSLMDGDSDSRSIRDRVSDDDETEERDDDQAYEKAFSAYLRGGMANVAPEQRSLITQASAKDQKELRAQGIATNAAGGYTVAPQFRARIVERLKFFAAVRDVAEVITTDTGATLPWPTNDDTANVGAILAENTQVTEQDVVIGQGSIGAYMYTSKLIRVSLQLLQDSAFDLEGFLSRRFSERLGRATNAHYTTGTGSSQPQGVVTGTSAGVTGATGTNLTVTYDSLIDLMHSVDPAYRQGSGLAFMLNDATIGSIRKLKDGDDRPLWQPSMVAGAPDTLLGARLIVNNDMPVMAAGAKSILYGDFNAGFLIRDVLGIQSLRLEERYADFLQVGFLAFLRTDSVVQDTNAIKAYVNGAAS